MRLGIQSEIVMLVKSIAQQGPIDISRLYKTMSIFPGFSVLDAPVWFNVLFYELWLYVRRHVPYCDCWLSWQRLNALMIVSRLYYIAIQKHVLSSVHYSDVNMNICISTE